MSNYTRCSTEKCTRKAVLMGMCRRCYTRDYRRRKKGQSTTVSVTKIAKEQSRHDQLVADVWSEFYIDDATYDSITQWTNKNGHTFYKDKLCPYAEDRDSPQCPNQGRWLDPMESGQRRIDSAMCLDHLKVILTDYEPDQWNRDDFRRLRIVHLGTDG